MSARRNEGGEVVSLHHLQVAMPAGEEGVARAFYGGLLGLDEVPKPAHLAKRGGCWFKGPAVELHLGVEAEFRPARKAHPAFQVEGLDWLRQRLEGSGVEIVEDAQLEGHRRFYAFDPFGNRLEFIENHADEG
jgi:catechol 2,3-dioxygenase-like lactoylglutathione lyase family enzyme